MNEFNEIIKNIKSKTNKIFYNWIKYVITSWFVKLNDDDINILTILTSFLANRINNLFIQDINYQFDLTDSKAIISLILPYINDANYDVYSRLTDLNELILSEPLDSNVLELSRTEVLNKNFKYTNIGIGLLNNNCDLNLNDREYNKLIYKIIYNNFVAINETLTIINGKLYVNWVNIYPLSLNNYKESKIYKNTINNIDNRINNIIKDIEYNGLYIGEFYNVYRNIYYESIKKIKWLIFFKNNKYYLQYLNEIFDFTPFFNFNNFSDIDIEDQDIFKKSIPLLDYEIWKNIIIFMVNNYTYTNLLDVESCKPFTMNLEMEDEDYEFTRRNTQIFNNITDEQIQLFLNKIEPMHIWDYIKEVLNKFDTTIYSKYLIKDNKIVDKVEFIDGINFKNIYNIAKTLSHDSDWDQLPTKYSSINQEQQKEFWTKFMTNTTNWLNLRNNLNLENGRELNPFEYNIKMQTISDKFNDIKFELVWNYLVYNGLLTSFDSEYNNRDIEKSNESEFKRQLKKKIKTNTEYKESYYYLTNTQYKDMKLQDRDKNDVNYIDILTQGKEQYWYGTYAMNWVTQINFFNHYLNHRILYITGGTGQGKSTQVPKLFMYSLKMLDYKNNGKVVCTQPRIGPTNSNTRRISDELGVPIIKYSDIFKSDIKTDNYYVEFAHNKEKHSLKNNNNLLLKMVTDGTLLIEMTNNPIMKTEFKTKNSKEIGYTLDNIYDVIIIDEAHEHNTNMDLILTLARQTCYMNNSIKLVIMSATMDDDEPSFRRYYRNINDNLVYPLRNVTEDPFNIDYPYIFHESIYLDRRFHIAPPGQVTQYEVIEKYEPNKTEYNIVNEILEKSTFGNILVFANGEGEIRKSVELFNKTTSKEIISIPYFAKLAQEYKNIIENEELYKIRTNKNIVHTEWSSEFIKSSDVQEGTYKRCIIVATNIAEASLTLSNLRYVIDNGYSKVSKYDSLQDQSILENEEISEASRKQRKGRVGRVAPGTVYYLYPKGGREKNMPKYKITQDNFSDSLITLLEKKNMNNPNENILIDELNPNSILYNIKDIRNYITTKREQLEKTLFYKKKIYKIFEKQYEGSWHKMYWPTEYNEFMKDIEKCMNKKESGYDLNILIDPYGIFYLVHPFENIITRNILGNIIMVQDGSKQKKKNIIPPSLFYNYIINLSYTYFLVDINATTYKGSHDNYIDPNVYYKTELADYVNEFKQKFSNKEISTQDVITILTANAYGSCIDVLQILSLLQTINKSIKNLLLTLEDYNNQDTEIEYLYNLINKFKNDFKNFTVFTIKNIKYDIYSKNKSKAQEKIDKFEIDKNKPTTKYTVKEWINFNSLKNNKELTVNKIIDNFLDNTDPIYNFRKYKTEINNWSEINNIKPNIMMSFLENYTTMLLNILTYNKDDDKKIDKVNPLDLMELVSTSFKKSLCRNNQLETIIRPFMHGKPLNFGNKIGATDLLHMTIGFIPIKNTDTKINETNRFYYYSRNNLEVSITNKIDIEWLFNTLPLYYKPSNFKNNYLKADADNILKYSYINNSLWTSFCIDFNNKWSPFMNFPFESEPSMPIFSEFIRNLKKYMLVYK